jgi:hypothetical protein
MSMKIAENVIRGLIVGRVYSPIGYVPLVAISQIVVHTEGSWKGCGCIDHLQHTEWMSRVRK